MEVTRLLPVLVLLAACGAAEMKIGDGLVGDSGLVGVDSGDCEPSLWYADVDGDGYGDPSGGVSRCGEPTGYVRDSGDCDDDDGDVHPGALEICNGVDDGCTGWIDVDAVDAAEWYWDGDGDGFGDPASRQVACDAATGWIADGSDCDDDDGDVHPEATEVCNDTDDDCNGDVDSDAVDRDTWYADTDDDGFGDALSTTLSCDEPTGFTDEGTDCDDGEATTSPGADELCDGVDNDCDGVLDEASAIDAATWYVDSDGDGFGDASSHTSACDAPAGHVADSTDCDDGDDGSWPGADEVCDDADNDCDGVVDEDSAVDAPTWYVDADGDGFGDADGTSTACEAPLGMVGEATDCDDGDSSAFPGADEVCDDADNDCDGVADEDSAVDAPTWYVDADGDGYGDRGLGAAACDAPTATVANSSDCDDEDPDVNPEATEVCNDLDDDCSGDVDDDAVDASAWYDDDDGDGFGDPAAVDYACDRPTGYVSNRSDCDDGDSTIAPDVVEACDGVDDDCDGSTDEGYTDSDGDGTANCVDPTVWSSDFSGDMSGWSSVSYGGNTPTWSTSGGYLHEASNAANSFYLSPDLGELEAYTVTVDVTFAGDLNDAAGIAFDYQSSCSTFFMRWMDPTGYYRLYGGDSQVDLYRCSSSAWTLLEVDPGGDYRESAGTWIEIAVQVDGDDITVYHDGTAVFTYTASGWSPIGPHQIGLYTYDNDTGVYYDNLVITNP